jgi:hypothetical protein
VSSAISEAKARRAERTKIDADWVLEVLADTSPARAPEADEAIAADARHLRYALAS